jgi:hypothetical protein
MAAKLVLKGGKLPHIWNVSARVGPNSDEPNGATDVELLNVLVVIALGNPAVKRFGIKGKMIPPNRTNVFDPILGFWIFRFQQLGRHPATDGVASPARGQFFAPGTPWVVVTINELAREADPDLWASLDRNTNVSAALRADLSR